MAGSLLKKLIFRMDGAADSARTRFTSEAGTTWEAEFCLHSGTTPQSPRLLVLFRNQDDVRAPQRYTQAAPGMSKVPEEAVEAATEEELRELLATSVEL